MSPRGNVDIVLVVEFTKSSLSKLAETETSNTLK